MFTLRNGFLLNLLIVTSVFSQPLTLEPYSEYNAIVFEDYSATSSDVEGRLAVGGNVNINHYSVGDKLNPNTLSDVLISGGDITFPSGRVYYGNILASGSIAGIGSAVLHGMESGAVVQGGASLPIDFQAAYSYFDDFSQQLALLSANTTYEYQWGGLYLHGDCSSPVQVFNLNGSDVLSAHTFQVDCIPEDAYVLFNIEGQQAGLTNMSMASLENHRTRVIYNFYEATSLTLSGIGVEGTILAPNADINNPQGVIKGQLIAKSWNGMMQINHVPFEGEVSAGNQAPEANDQLFSLQKDETLQWQLDASNINGNTLTYEVVAESQFGTISGTAPDLVYTPLDGFTGVDTFEYRVNNGELDSDVATVTFEVGQTVCKLYPYTVESQVINGLNPNDVVNNYSTSVGHGNYSLLTWNGANDTNTLTTSFEIPGNSENYVNPDDSNDERLNINDWVQGAPGKKNAKHVRDALDQLVGETIIIPVWSKTRGSGSHFDYLVNGFANIELTDYKLNGQSKISFIYKGETTCYNFAPFTFDAVIITQQNTAVEFVLSDTDEVVNGIQNLLAVTDGDQDDLNYIITNQPTDGTLSGIGPDFIYTPNTNFDGTDSFDFKVNDGTVDSNISTITITVSQNNQAPTAARQNLALDEDQNVSITLTGSDPSNDPLTFNVQSQPTNGQLTGVAPDLIYTPTANFFGSDVFTFTVNDGNNESSTATISLSVSPVNDLPIAESQLLDVNEDGQLSITLTGSDIDGDLLNYQLVTQGVNGTLSGSGSDLTYQPDADFFGTDQFDFLVNDGISDSPAVTIFIDVIAVNDKPHANNLTYQVDQGQTVAVTLSGSDIEGDAMAFVINTQPQNGTLTGSRADLSYTPDSQFSGSDSFTYYVNDGVLNSVTATVTINVEAVNQAPVASNLSLSADEDVPTTITLLGSDADADALTYLMITQPSSGTLTGTSPDLVYTPNADFSGTDSFTYLINDGTLDSNIATVNLTIVAVNDAPAADTQSYSVNEDDSLLITLSGTDVDGDVLSYLIDTQPANGVLSGTAPNLTYTPNMDYTGSDSITYHVNDGTIDSAAVTVIITVEPTNDAPVANNLSISLDEDTATALTLTGSDLEGDALTYQTNSQPVSGILSGTAPDLTYTPNADFNGADEFNYVVNDGQLDSVVATIILTVNPINDAPEANIKNYSVAEDESVSIILTGSDVDGDVLSYLIDTQPANGSLTGSNDSYTYTPNVNFSGSDAFTYHVNDGTADSVVVTVTITVNSNNDVPIANDLSVVTDEDIAVVVTLTGTDPEGDVLVFQVLSQPSSGVLSGTAPNLTYTPNTDFNGLDAFTYVVNDGQNDSSIATASISVTVQNDLPVIADQSLTVDEDTPLDISTIATDVDADPLSYSIVVAPTEGTLTGDLPNVAYQGNENYFGSDSFTVEVNDGQGGLATAVISITINAVNDQATVDALILTATYQTALELPFVGSDIEDAVVTFQIQDQPTNGTITENAGVFTYTPENGFAGTDQLTYVAIDTEGLASDVATIDITVESNNNLPPEITSTPPSVGSVGTDIQYDVEAIDPDGDVLNYELMNAPSAASIDQANGLISWAPKSSYSLGLDINNSQCKLNTGQSGEYRQVQLVSLIDGSGSMSDERAFLSTWLPQLNGEMLSVGLGQNDDMEFAVGRFERGGKLKLLPSGDYFGDIDEISNVLVPISDLTGPSGGSENGVNSLIDILEDYQYNHAAEQIFILMTDEHCSSCRNAPEKTIQLNQMLAEREDVLHTVIPSGIMECPDGTAVMGIDSQYNGYVGLPNGDYRICKNASFETASADMFEHYIEPAFLTGGSVWDVGLISGIDENSLSASESIAKVIAQIAQTQAATVELADLYFESLSQIGDQLSITIGNRGIAESLATTINITDSTGHILSLNTPVLAVDESVDILVDLNTLSAGELKLSIVAENECLTDNNAVKMAYFDIQVDDNNGGSDNQNFLLSVTETNIAPTINPIDDIQSPAGLKLALQIEATDVNKGDALSYSILNGAEQATVSPSGLLEWKPTADDLGSDQGFTVVVTDLTGASAQATFNIAVINIIEPLMISSEPNQNAVYGMTYQYQVAVNHDPVSVVEYELLNGADGMSIDTQGLISWDVASDANIEVVTLVIFAQDQFGNNDTQSFVVALDEPPSAPEIISKNDKVIIDGENFSYTSVFADINAFEHFQIDFIYAPDDIYINNYHVPTPDFQYEQKANHWEFNASTLFPENISHSNHWCGSLDPNWINLAPQLDQVIEIGPRTGDTLNTNILATSLTDTNNDGVTNLLDTQYIIYTRENGIAAMNAATLEELWFQPNIRAARGGFSNPLAAADIDQDGNNEILVMDISGYLNALSSTGDIIWTATDSSHFSAATNVLLISKDIDADGDLEIIAGTNVFDHLGNLLIDMGQFNFTSPSYPAVGDIDQDGTLEIIQNNTIFNHDGSVFIDGLGDGNFYAIANFDADPELEWVQSKKFINTVTLFDDDGSIIWENTVKTANLPSVADIDHDGMLEIVMTYATIKADGTIIRDEAGDDRYDSVLTDLNLDGAFELISSWNGIIAKDPITGDRIFNWQRRRGFYNFVLVDRFSNGEYQIVFPHWNGDTAYIDFIKAADGAWAGGPGETKQTVFDKTLNANGQPNLAYGVLLEQMAENTQIPDFHVTGPQIEESADEYRIFTTLSNITPSIYQGNLTVNFYHDAIDSNNLIGSTIVSNLGVNEKKVVYMGGLIDPYNPPGDSLIAEVIPEITTADECRYENNIASSEYVFWQVTDNTGLSDEQAYTIRTKHNNSLPYSVNPPPQANALQRYQHQLTFFRDYELDDKIFIVYQKPEGMQFSSSGYIDWVPRLDQVGSHEMVFHLQDDSGNSKSVRLDLLVEPPLNLPPYFTSYPDQQAISSDSQFTYQVTALDPEGGETLLSLDNAPNGMNIDSSGLITWSPSNSQIGDYTIEITATDDQGLMDSQSFVLNIIDTDNNAPVINSIPDLSPLSIGDTLTYNFEATDPDGDTIAYSIIEAPTSAQLDTNGLLTFNAVVIGESSFTLEARDARGAWARQSFSLYVNNEPNTAPVIENLPTVIQPLDGSDYFHQVIATDAENDPLIYRLLQAPLGMTINGLGELQWSSAYLSQGRYPVEFEVNDGKGGFASQTYDLFVGNGNIAPSITSEPTLNTTLNRLYQYSVEAVDPDSAPLFYELISAPTGMVIDDTGLISWTPPNEGVYPVTVQVADEASYVRQTWNLTVSDANNQLDVQISLIPGTVLINEPVLVTIQVINATGNSSVSATLDGEELQLDANLQATVSSDELGSHSIAVSVTDDLDTINSEAVFVVTEVVETLPPETDILSPEDGGIITGFNDIRVRVQDDNLAEWKLSYRYAEDDFTGRVTLAEGTDNIDDAVVANWDTSLLRNGIYVLLIEATDLSGQRSSIVNNVFLEGDLKLGHFSIAFEDLNIPVAGIPITITRGYDTRDRNRDRAFGKGWSIGYQSVRVQESRVPGLAWYMETGFYSIGPVRLPRYCVKPASEPLVSVVLPDGQVEKFKVKARTLNPASDTLSNCQNITTPDYFAIEFIPQGDTNSSITSNVGQFNLKILNGNLEELTTNEPIDPNLYTLTMLDGTEYALDQGFNVRKIKATTGHELTFTENGIEHSGGLSVSFIRDTEGRITRIEKANGEGVDYAYDANGDLVSFTDLNGRTTTYTYIQDHYLEDIVDPRGIRVARNEYDAEGRLVAHIDAMGNRIEYDNDLIAMTSTITDRRGHATVNAFDNAGNIIAQTNALGETTSYEYNNLRLETARVNDLGHRTEWTYDSQGNQLTEKDPLNHITTSTYNRKAELLTQTDATGQVVITNEYNPDYDPQSPGDPQHGYAQLNTVTDALGRTTQFHWRSGINSSTGESISVNTGYTDADGNRYDISPISGGTNSGLSGASTDLNGLRTETTYDDEARPLTETQVVTDELGVTLAEYTTTYEYNAGGDVVKVTDALGNITRTEYNSLNKVSATIDALGRRTEMAYDDRGNQVLTRYPDGSTEIRVYDAENNVIESTDRAGRTTKTIYDALNRAEAVIYPDDTPGDDSDNPMTVNSYDSAGRLVVVSDAGGNVTSYEYDDAGRRTKTIDALGNETTSVYDAVGRRTQSTDALGRVTTFEYNALGNLVKTNFATGKNTTTTYDSLSRKVAETDLAGLQTQYEYDDAGQLTAVIDSLNQRTEYTYDQRGNKLTQTDANGHTTSWAYDALNRVTSRTLPMGEVESYTYDAVGNRVSKTDFNGDTTSYEYNNLNQLIKTTYSDATTVVNTYTITGQMASVTETNGTTTYSYDAQDRLSRIDYPTGNFVQYQYDLNGNRTQVQTSNQTVDYTFDQLNRLKTVTDANGTTTYTYDAVGNRASRINANGVTASYTYDDLNRLTDLVHTNSLNTNIASYSYELGANGNRLSLTEGTGRVVNYSYDNLYRLISETVTDSVTGDHTSAWSYDPVGNRLQQSIDGVVTTYTYKDNDHLLSETENATTTSYVYDGNGNTLSKSIDGLIDTEYSYSKDNRMLSANTGTSNISYTYDAGGIRQSQTVDGQTTNFLVDPNRSYAQVLEEQDSLFIPQVVYTYGDDLINQTNAQGVHTFGYDGLGSTRILTDVTGTVQNSYGYQAFGELDYQFGTLENSYLFTGEQYDQNVGFYYLRARYYNPEIGRFQNMDTFPGMQFEPKSLHKYLYTHADPINNIDPSGYMSLYSQSLASSLLSRVLSYSTPRLFAAIGSSTVRNTGLAVLASIGGGYAGYQLYAMLSGIPASAALEAEDAENRGKDVAQEQSDTLELDPIEGVLGKRAVIGENQDGRVKPAARALKAITIAYVRPYIFERPLKPKQELLSIAFNAGWIKTLRINRFEVYDIGRDPARVGQQISRWYAVELAALKGYDRHFRIKWP